MANYNLTQTGDEVQAYIDSIPVIDVTGTLSGSVVVFTTNPYPQVAANYEAGCGSIIRLTVGEDIHLIPITRFDGTAYKGSTMTGWNNVVATIEATSASAIVAISGIDDAPTAGSRNPVTSTGINTSLQNLNNSINDSLQTLQNEIDSIQPIVIEGNVTNAPDEEDITTDSDDLLKFKNRVPGLNQLGYFILRRDQTFAAQVTEANTIYEVRYEFDLNGGSVTIPSGCVLKFNGGSVKNGNLNMSGSAILANYKVFYNCHISNVAFEVYRSEWYVASATSNTDSTSDVENLMQDGNGHTIKFSNGIFVVNNTGFVVDEYTQIIGGNSLRGKETSFYIKGCSGTFITTSGNLTLKGIYFDASNGEGGSSRSNTLSRFIETSGNQFLIENCRFGYSNAANECIYMNSASFFLEMRECEVTHIPNGVFIRTTGTESASGDNTTLSFYKCYIHYCRQVFDIPAGSLTLNECVLESCYTLGNVSFFGSVVADSCHIENIGYSVNAVYEGVTNIYGTQTPLDCFLHIAKGGSVKWVRCAFAAGTNLTHLSYIYRLYGGQQTATWRGGGILAFSQCTAFTGGKPINEIVYCNISTNNVPFNFSVSVENENFTDQSFLESVCRYPISVEYTGTGLSFGPVKIVGENNSVAVVVNNSPDNIRPIAIKDFYLKKGYVIRGSEPITGTSCYELQVTHAQTEELSVANYAAGSQIGVSSTANLHVGDSFYIRVSYSAFVQGTIASIIDGTHITLTEAVNVASTSYNKLVLFATRPKGDSYGVVTSLPSVSASKNGCLCLYAGEIYQYINGHWIAQSYNYDGIFVVTRNNSYARYRPAKDWIKNTYAETPLGILIVQNGVAFIMALKNSYGKFSENSSEASGLQNLTFAQAFADFNGEQNTNTLKTHAIYGASGSAVDYCINYHMEDGNGYGIHAGKWYLPSYGQARIMCDKIDALNVLLGIISGADLLTSSMWTSSQYTNTYMFKTSDDAYFFNPKKTSSRIRPVANVVTTLTTI